jgi:3-oxoacyl-[acyl-carrier-protein] synthase II
MTGIGAAKRSERNPRGAPGRGEGSKVDESKTVVVACDMATPYGWGTEACWKGLLSGRTAIGPFDRFDTGAFPTRKAGVIEELVSGGPESLAMQMLAPLLGGPASPFPEDAFLILATTTGEIDFLERQALGENREASESRLDRLLAKVIEATGVHGGAMVVSAACASSSAAIARGAAMIRGGGPSSVLVVACDCVSEFVFSGFSSLMALDADVARPFDRGRSGLSLGEAAGFVLLMSGERASREGRDSLGEILGWGLTNDANHMAGPSRDGAGLARAIGKALGTAEAQAGAVGCISAHGTGTVYNDAMEMKAFKSVFGARPIPVYSIKGGTGHTLGAAGLIETIVALRTLREHRVPPTVNLERVDDGARGWVFRESVEFSGEVTLSTNSGFGGVNCALALRAPGGARGAHGR